VRIGRLLWDYRRSFLSYRRHQARKEGVGEGVNDKAWRLSHENTSCCFPNG
jgi:hypothetical protein